MIEYTLFEKIKTVFNLVIDSPLFLILLLGISLMLIDMLFISKQDKKTKVIYAGVSLILIIFFMISYIESVILIFDTVAKNIVTIIYFPTVLEYILMLLISIIILLISAFSTKTTKAIKRVNAFVLIINSFLFFLILDQIAGSNVDLTNKISIYINSNLIILLELSIIIFAVWIIGLVLYKTINVLSPKIASDEFNLEITLNSESTKSEEMKDSNNTETKIEYVLVEKEEEDLFSLEEYRQMKELLEVIKKNKKK